MRNADADSPVKDFFRRLDYLQMLAAAILLGIGLVFIHSTGVQVDTPASRSFFFRQIQWIAAGAVLYVVLALLDYRTLFCRIGSWCFYAVTLLLLVAVLIWGLRIYGATRWLNFFGFRLQPSEPAKLAVIAVLSALFSSRFHQNYRGEAILLAFAATLIPFLLIAAEPDLGSALILPAIYLVLLFASGLKWRHLLIWLILLVIAAGVLTVDCLREKPLLLRGYQRDRIRVFLNPELDRTNRGHNAYQARLAVGSGGFSGKGIGEGTQNELGFLPQTVSNNDFIFSVIAEETGFSGVLGVLAAYALLLYTMLRTAFFSPHYGRCLALGAAVLIFVHVFINVGMSIGLAPVTGLPLPLVSYGGSFMLTTMAMLGVLQSIRRHRRLDDE